MPYQLNVPSNLIEFKDGGLSFRAETNTTSTKSVLVLGLAVDGPLEPVAVDPTTVDAVFGKDVHSNGIANGGTISTAVNDLYRAGCRDIRAMKISGSTAKTTIYNEANSVSSTTKIEEAIGYVEGNEETVLVLAKPNAIENTIKVYVNDKLLSIPCEYNSADNSITIPAGVADCGAPVTVRYSYVSTGRKTITETLTVMNDPAEGLYVQLSNKPYDGKVSITSDDIELSEARFSVNPVTGRISFVQQTKGKKDSRSFIVEHAIIAVTYTYEEQDESTTTETGNSIGNYFTATSFQRIQLEHRPKVGTVMLYSNDNEVPTSYYSVNGQTITIKKDRLSLGDELVCTYLIEKTEEVRSEIDFTSYFAGNVYNNGRIVVSNITNKTGKVIGKYVAIHKPDDKKVTGEEPLVYSSLTYPTFGELVDVINSDLRNGIYECSTDSEGELVSSLIPGTYRFTGGDSGINWSKNQLKEALSGERAEDGSLINEGVYQLLEGYNVDYVVLTGVYADDDNQLSTKESFDYDLALFCAAISYKTRVTYGAIATAPCKNTTLRGIKEYVDKLSAFNKDGRRFLLKQDGKIYYDSNNKTIDLGQYIRVVGGAEPIYLNDDLGKHYANPAVAYIGVQSTMNPQSSPTNKPLTSSKGLRFKIQSSQLQSLTEANIITFTSKYDTTGSVKEQAYIFDSMTCALPGSDYVRTTTCEVVKVVGDDVREITDPYIGEPPTVESKNSMASALSKRFSQRKTEGVVGRVGFEIIETPAMQSLGQCSIRLDVVAPGERRAIKTVIALSPSAN